MNAFKTKLKLSLLSCVIAGGSFCSTQAWSALSISDTPLFMGIQADPNIMFILDDSGSMHFEFMPNEIGENVYSETTLFPHPPYIWGDSTYGWSCGGDRYFDTPNFEDDNAYNLIWRSSHFNKLFYDPDITYEPWYKADGTQWPDADPTNAYYNPGKTSVGGLNLTQEQTVRTTWFEASSINDGPSYGAGSSSCYATTESYWPITYYKYTGDDVDDYDDYDSANYTKVQITSSTAATEVFTSPNGTTRTRDEEIQNFANWFSYYRSRILMSRSGIGAAFATQGEDLRVGFATINKGSSTVDGVSTRSIIDGVRSFTGSDREDFYTNLYERSIPTSGTPLRRALEAAGEYFSRTDNSGPWGATPGTNDTTDHVECRKSYSILMTDGYWNGSDPSSSSVNANNDGTNGATHSNPDSQNYIERDNGNNYTGYIAEDPFQDEHTGTLADVAMYYWKNDLRPTLANKIDVREQGDRTQELANPAYWQHMITFGVSLGVTGSLDIDDTFQAAKDGTEVEWPDPFGATGEAKLDDLLHAAINSRGGYFSASNPTEFANQLKNVLDTIASDVSSSSSAVANTTRLDTDTLVYQAKFKPGNWSGQLLSYKVDKDANVDTDNPEWDADDKLPSHSNRDILTYVPGSGGAEFLWANLSTTQKNYLNQDIFGTVDNEGTARVSFLRGDVTETGPASSPFRDRSSDDLDDSDGYDILGDIVNSDPIFVGTGDFGYGRETSALSATEKSAYNTFRSSSAYLNRDGMLYIGANDGMVHGFNAKTGVEEFAYIPNALYPKLSALTSSDYTHQYYVDATPHAGDAYIDSDWITMLTGSLGAGGRAMYAIDITDPDSVGASDVMWETEADDSDSDLRHMGYILGTPQLVRTQDTNNGTWVVLAGNGYNSADHKAVLMVLDAETGKVIKTIDTGVGSAAEPNGLGTPLPVDIDGDRLLDAVYAGDLHGNLWKFDFSDKNSNKWDVAIKGGGGSNEPLFQACDGTCSSSTWQPITTQPQISSHDQGVMILFGTGRYFTTGDATVGSSPRTEAIYGIFDCGANFNNKLCGSQVAKSELIQQEIILEDDSGTSTKLDDDIRVSSNYDVEITTKVKGWYMELKPPGASHGDGERVVANPVLVNDAILFVTFTPDSNPCNFGGSSWLMEVDPQTGGRFETAKLDANGDGVINEEDYVMVNGDKVYITGTREDEKRSAPGILHGGGEEGKTVFKIFSGSSGNINIEINKGVNKAGRQSWRQLR